jgi:Polysaccharide lyase
MRSPSKGLYRLAAVAAAVVVSLMVAQAAGASVIFNGNFETGNLNNFNILTQLGAPAPVITTSPVRTGRYSVTMTVGNGQERSELQPIDSAGATIKMYPLSTALFSDSIYLHDGFPTTPSGCSNCFQTLLQWKGDGGTTSTSPPVELTVADGNYVLHGGSGCPGGPEEFRLTLGPAETGVWTDFQFEIYFGRVSDGGWVSAWVNGTQVLSQFRPPCGTVYPAPDSRFDSLRLGYYRDPAILQTGTVTHDEYEVQTAQ